MMNTLPSLISVTDFIEKLNSASGAPIGPKAVYRLIQQPGFPAIMIGSRYYIMIDRVNDWMMEQGNQKTAPEPCEVMSNGQ